METPSKRRKTIIKVMLFSRIESDYFAASSAAFLTSMRASPLFLTVSPTLSIFAASMKPMTSAKKISHLTSHIRSWY